MPTRVRRAPARVLKLAMAVMLAALLIAGGLGGAAEHVAGQLVSVTAESAGDRPTVRIKDIARLQGVRDNQLFGLGLVVGLDGTGDGRGAQANVQMAANMLERFGLTIDRNTLRTRNVAAVMVTAELPAFVRPGDRLDVTVSSVGDAKSLQGGILLQTPLQAANGQVYVVAAGPVSIGGFAARGGGTQVQRNHPVVGRVPGGGIVERTVPVSLGENGLLTLLLGQPDFTTASRVAEVVNRVFTRDTARALDRSAVQIAVPPAFAGDVVSFIALLEELPITPDAVAKVVINERTGTVVIGHDARIATVAVAHGNLTVRITPEVTVHQPPPFTDGETVVTEVQHVEVEEERGRLMLLQSGASVADVVAALNAIGATPRDVIAILQAIKAAGALHAVLEVL